MSQYRSPSPVIWDQRFDRLDQDLDPNGATQYRIMVSTHEDPFGVYDCWNDAQHHLLKLLQCDMDDMPIWRQWYIHARLHMGLPIYLDCKVVYYITETVVHHQSK